MSIRVVCRVSAMVTACALAVSLVACARHPGPRVLPPAAASAAHAAAYLAETLIGTPYRDGGAGPEGFDCSGLVFFVYGRQGVPIPRDVRRQWLAGREIARDEVRVGDLLFFATTGSGPTHVTLALDTDRFVHAPSSRGAVRAERLTSGYWATRFLGARRIVN